MHIANNIRAYILAGGKSSRMGDDKGLLDLNGKCLIEHVIDAVKPAISNITIVTGNPAYSKFGIPLVADLLPNAGPAGGIYTALIHTTAMQTFICSCDMPFITTAGLQYLLEQSEGADICVPLYHGHPEPLFGLYAADSTERWLAVLQQGTYKLQKYFDAFNTRYVPVDNNLLFDNLFFSNINSPADLEAARKQWR